MLSDRLGKLSDALRAMARAGGGELHLDMRETAGLLDALDGLAGDLSTWEHWAGPRPILPGHVPPGHLPPGHLPPGHLPPGHVPDGVTDLAAVRRERRR